MRLVAAFMSGVVVCGLLILGAKSVLPTQADEITTDNITDNLSESLTALLPDIERIYKEALITPFIKAEDKIYDEDIAEFYSDLLDRTGLRPDE
ncbi:MAG TPA: hypothetical protein G4O16_07705 [Dehalococcoidia bacterium]|nr:hypothetical protein [Dehalococcoidia bacterium]